MLTITIPPEMETGVKREAERLGVGTDEFVRGLVAKALPGDDAEALASQARANQSTIALLAAWEKETATDDPAEIARREAEFVEFKRAMNRNRLEMEGPDARKPFPES